MPDVEQNNPDISNIEDDRALVENADFRDAIEQLAVKSEGKVPELKPDQELPVEQVSQPEKHDLAPQLVMEITKITAETLQAVAEYGSAANGLMGDIETRLTEVNKKIDSVENEDDKRDLRLKISNASESLTKSRGAVRADGASDLNYLMAASKEVYTKDGSIHGLKVRTGDALEGVTRQQSTRSENVNKELGEVNRHLGLLADYLDDASRIGAKRDSYLVLSAWLRDTVISQNRGQIKGVLSPAEQSLFSRLGDKRMGMAAAIDYFSR